MRNLKKGFTLIELLVVIAIIGVLASVMMASLNSARAKARDARRRSDLKQIANALELYYSSNKAYPSTSGAWWGNCSGYGSHGITGPTGWIPNLAPTFMANLPLDPRPIGTTGCYIYRSNGIEYKALSYQTVEKSCPVPTTDAMWDPVRSAQCTFQVSTQGARSTY